MVNWLKLKNKETKEFVEASQEIKKTNFEGVALGIDSVVAWRSAFMKSCSLNILQSFALIIVCAGYFFVFPLKEVNYLTVGYSIEDDKVKVVDVTPADNLEIKQLKLLAKFFIEDTIIKGLSNYRDDRLLLSDLKIVSSRTTPKVMEKIKVIQRKFERQENIASRQIVILSSEDDGFGAWALTFKTVDEGVRGNIYENIFKAKVTFDILGFAGAENMNLPIELIKENPNPLGLKIKDFFRVQEEEKEEE